MDNPLHLKTAVLYTFLVISLSGCSESPQPGSESTWWKGNLHTHTLWSDGDHYPEVIIDWYKKRDYDFLALSDHNTLAEGERWIDTTRNGSGSKAFGEYIERFGDDWVETSHDSLFMVRLKTLEEFRSLFEEEGEFILIQSEEISDRFESKPIHLNATNIQERIDPQGGASLREVLQNNVDAVLEQRERLEIPMFPHINHPNFGWAITAEDLIALMGEQFFEVYNGHPAVNNYGDKARPGLEKMWDIITTRRILKGLPILFGIAVDDSHNYHEIATNRSNSGRAWVMVRAESLSPESIVHAMEAGDFYGTTGVQLHDVKMDSEGLTIRIQEEEGISYETHFIGTLVSHDTTSTPMTLRGAYITRSYSPEVGEVLKVVEGLTPSYEFKGDELFVRAKVVSSKSKENPYREGETEMAWTQPHMPK